MARGLGDKCRNGHLLHQANTNRERRIRHGVEVFFLRCAQCHSDSAQRMRDRKREASNLTCSTELTASQA